VTKFASVGVAVAILMVMGAMMPMCLSTEPVDSEMNTNYYLVYDSTPNMLYAMAGADFNVVENYDAFSMVQLSDNKIELLKNSGYDVIEMVDRTIIDVPGYVFDTTVGAPSVPQELKAKEYLPGVAGLYIVQMIGPVKNEWVDAVAQAGAEILKYVAYNAYEVRMTPEQSNVVRSLDCVGWVGVYEPAYKISPDLQGSEVIITLLGCGIPSDALSYVRGRMPVWQEGTITDGYIFYGSLPSQAAMAEIAASPYVQFIEPYIVPELHDEMGMQITGGYAWYNDPDSNVATPYRTSGTHGSYANQIGWDGAGVTIGIADSGLGDGTTPNAGHPDFTGRVIGGIDLGTTVNGWVDAMGHGTHCAGLMAADGYEGTGTKYAGFGPYYAGMGQAHESQVYAVQIFEGSGATADIPADYGLILESAYTAGARVHSNSWGSNTAGAYSAADQAYDISARDSDDVAAGNQQMVIVCSAGNAGSGLGTIGSPGNGKNVITVGATENYMPDADSYGSTFGSLGGYPSATYANNPDEIISFSSRGWSDHTGGGRIKPDVCAPGTDTLSTRSPSETSDNLYGFYTPDTRYQWCSGTSQAAPTVTGGAAVVYQWYQSRSGSAPSPALVKALLINSAVDIGTADIPNQNEGWGRMYLPTIVNPTSPWILKDSQPELTTGTYAEVAFSYVSASQPLKVTLAWTDKNAVSGDTTPLVNNLDLSLTSPTAGVYHGNTFVGGVTPVTTIPVATFDINRDGWDETNNVECIYIPAAQLQAGTYTLRVTGFSVVGDADNDGSNDQDYSLAIYNAAQGTTATATGPAGGPTNVAVVTLTYVTTFTPTFVNIYYTKSTSSPYTWVLAGNDTTVDGSFPYTISAGSGTYSWYARAIGGGSTEIAPLTTTVPEKSSYILDVTAPAAPSPLTVQHWGYRTTITNYTYAGVTAAAGPHNAWWYVLGTATPPSQADMNAAGTEYTDAQYTPIVTSDNTRNNVARGNMNTVTQNRYEINGIAEATASMTNIDITWEGQYSTAGTGSMYAYNFVTAAWVLQGATIAFAANTEQTVTRSITTGFANYISGGTLRFLMHESARPVTAVDFVKVTISTGVGSTLLDNTLNWTHSGTDVAQYNIYCSALNTGPWDGTTLVTSVPVGTNTYGHLNKGMADATLWWYVVRAQDAAGNIETNTNAVQEPGTAAYWQNITVVLGWNLISVPYNAANTALPYSLTDQANGGAGLVQWDRAHWFKAVPDAFYEPWKNFNKNWPAALNDLKNVVNTMGVWIHVTTVGDGQICIGGSNYTKPVSTVTQLRAGWNMVGFPSDDVAYTVAMFRTDIGQASAVVEQYDGGQLYLTSAMASATAFTPGRGYWIYVPADCVWTKTW